MSQFTSVKNNVLSFLLLHNDLLGQDDVLSDPLSCFAVVGWVTQSRCSPAIIRATDISPRNKG